MLIKICGLTDVKETEYLRRNKVDFCGMVLFFEKSKRNITIDKAKEIIAALDKSIKPVAVVVSPSLEEIRLIEQAGFAYVQIHGQCEEAVLTSCSIPILKAFNVSDLDNYEYYCSFDNIKGFVFDAGAPGSGSTFDWDMLKALKLDKSRIHLLAGGLNPDNVAMAVKSVSFIDGVDVSSGVEYTDRPGKDPALVDTFVAACNT